MTNPNTFLIPVAVGLGLAILYFAADPTIAFSVAALAIAYWLVPPHVRRKGRRREQREFKASVQRAIEHLGARGGDD